MSGASQPGHESAVVSSAADKFGELVVAQSKAFVKRNPVISLTWVAGLLLSILATGFTPSLEAERKYERKLQSLDFQGLSEAEEEVMYWNDVYYRSRGWFWTCDERCMRNKREYERKRDVFDAMYREHLQGEAEAKSELGLFSYHGVEEARNLFWRQVSGGKEFAKRATMWDALFIAFSPRRDEGLMSVLIRIAFNFLVNLTMGLFVAVVKFLFVVWQVIWSYQPDPVSMFAFFAMAAIAAVSLLATWLLGLAAVGVTGVYAVAKVAENAQIEAARQQQSSRIPGGAYGQQQRQQQQYYQQTYTQQQQSQARERRPYATAPGGTGSNWDHLD